MSLINDALLDLERRKSGQEPSSLQSSQASAVKRKANWVYLSVLVVAVFSGGYGLAVFKSGFKSAKTDVLLLSGRDSQAPALESKGMQTATSAAVDKQRATAELTAVTRAVEIDQQPSPQASNSSALTPRQGEALITLETLRKQLFLKAENAEAELRLSLPKGDNAAEYYQQLLSMDPADQRAIAGLERIKQRYLTLYEARLSKRDKPGSMRHAKRLSTLLTASEVPLYAEKIKQLDRKYAAAGRIDGDSTRAGQSLSQNQLESAQSKRVQAAHSELVGASESQLNIVESSQQKLSNLVNEINSDIDNSELVKAQRRLNDARKVYPQAAELAELGLQIYFKQENWSQLSLLLVNEQQQQRSHVYYQARLIQHSQNNSAALAYLKQQQALNLDARAMFAALLQADEDYVAALEQYRLLVKKDKRNGVYWLGRALSADSLNRTPEALSAYRKSMQLGKHSAAIEKFIHGRLAELQKREDKQELSQR